MASPPQSTLILGAGELGTPILHALAVHPSRTEKTALTVLLRPSTLKSPSPAKQSLLSMFQTLNISTLACDIATVPLTDLVTLFTPFTTIVGCTGMTYPSGTQLKISQAALTAKVPRYFPWQFGVDYDVIGRGSSQDLFSEQIEVREMLRNQSGTKWVIISTGMFMSFLFEGFFGVVDRERNIVRALGGPGNQVTVTSPQDIGRVVAELIWNKPEVEGVVYTAGQTVRYGQLAEILKDVFEEEEWSVDEWSVDTLKEELKAEPEDGLRKYRIVFAEGRGVAWEEQRTIDKKLGMKLQDVRGWLEENWVGRRVNE